MLAAIMTASLSSELALDESKSLRSVLVDVLLVCICVVAIAAVGIGSITVRLEDAGVCGRALESGGALGEL